ncbi:virion associated protein [Ralstonia phage UAM5]|nr:virion associated protein [Ralstonia phage UAM5]
MGGKGGGDAPAPDPNVGVAALKNAELGQNWLDFAKQQFEVGNIRQDAMDALTTKVTNQQLATQDQASAWANEDRARYKATYQPMEDQFAAEAKNYDSPERQAQMAAEAKSDVERNAAQQTQASQRSMAAMGLNPMSGRFQGQNRATSTITALAGAGAENAARQTVRDKGLALRADAINMGKGLPSQAASAAGLGLNAGNAAVGNTQTANNNFYQNTGIMSQGYGGAMQGYNNMGSLLNSQYNGQVNAWSAQQQAGAASGAGLGSMVGSLGGAAIMVF